MTANADLGNIERPISEDNLNSSTASTEYIKIFFNFS